VADSPKVGLPSAGCIRAVHPDHGNEVMFVPGELLPAWAAEALRAGRGGLTDGGHIVLDLKGGASCSWSTR
jgi:hypothetical protein